MSAVYGTTFFGARSRVFLGLNHQTGPLSEEQSGRSDARPTKLAKGYVRPRERRATVSEVRRHAIPRLDSAIAQTHHDAGHPGVRRTLSFVKQTKSEVTRRQLRKVVSGCHVCRSIDPAPVK